MRTKLLEASDCSSQEAPKASSQLYNRPIDTTWPSGVNYGVGFFNTGNTCFLNSALQCLLHTPPLVNVLMRHGKEDKCASNSKINDRSRADTFTL